MEFSKELVKVWLCIVPLFFAMNPVAILPLFVSFTQGMPRQRVRGVIFESALTAGLVTLIFLIVGQYVFELLGITMSDFMIAGGCLLFLLSLKDLMSGEKREEIENTESLGATPLGVPLLVGPAVLTTELILLQEFGLIPTVIAIVFNVLLAGAIFFMSPVIHRALGKAGSKIVSKLASLLLAAIAVMLVRKGILSLISGLSLTTGK